MFSDKPIPSPLTCYFFFRRSVCSRIFEPERARISLNQMAASPSFTKRILKSLNDVRILRSFSPSLLTEIKPPTIGITLTILSKFLSLLIIIQVQPRRRNLYSHPIFLFFFRHSDFLIDLGAILESSRRILKFSVVFTKEVSM